MDLKNVMDLDWNHTSTALLTALGIGLMIGVGNHWIWMCADIFFIV